MARECMKLETERRSRNLSLAAAVGEDANFDFSFVPIISGGVVTVVLSESCIWRCVVTVVLSL